MTQLRFRGLALAAAGTVLLWPAGCDTQGGAVLGELLAGLRDGEVTLILLNNSNEDVEISARYSRGAAETRRTTRLLQSKTPPAMQRVVPTAADLITLDVTFPGGTSASFQQQLVAGRDYVAGGVITFVIDPDGPRVFDQPILADQPPIANAGSDFSTASSRTVFLDGRGSFDPDAEPLSYRWEQITGPPGDLDDATLPAPLFTVPAAGPGSSFTILFRLTVSDGRTRPVSDEVLMTVLGPPLPPPILPLHVSVRLNPNAIAEGGQTQLDAQISGGVGGYDVRWTARSTTAGPTGVFVQPSAARTAWVAPRGFIGDYVLTCTVRDATGNTNSAMVTVVVKVDCNFNLIPDEADVNNGVSQDADGDGIPDDCK